MKWIVAHRKLLSVITIALLIISFIPLFFSNSLEELLATVSNSLPLAALALFAVFSLKAVLFMLPSVTLYMAAGLIFPSWLAIIIIYAGVALELTISYFVGKKLGLKNVMAMLESSKLAKKALRGGNNTMLTCLLARMLPVPFDIVSMFFGVMKMPYYKYLLMSLIGLIPNIVPWVFVGASVLNPLSLEFILPFAVCIALTLGIYFIIRFNMAKRGSTDESKP